MILPDGYEEPEYYDEDGSASTDETDETEETDSEYVEPDIIEESDSEDPEFTTQ